jgi:hypothetical protein
MIDATITLIDAHQKAWTAIQVLGDDVDDQTLDRTTRVESDMMMALADAPCRSGEDFYLKLEYLARFLLKREEKPSVNDGFGALAIAYAAWDAERGGKTSADWQPPL